MTSLDVQSLATEVRAFPVMTAVYRSKQLQIFFDQHDERAFSDALVGSFPQTVFVDDNVWDTQEPVIRPSIADCSTGFCFLWNRAVVKQLSTFARKDGRFEGPTAGEVVQVIRSRLTPDKTLLSGRIAASYAKSDAQMSAFALDTFKLAKRVATSGMCSIDPDNGEVRHNWVIDYIVGRHAARQVEEGSLRFLKDRSTQNFYRST